MATYLTSTFSHRSTGEGLRLILILLLALFVTQTVRAELLTGSYTGDGTDNRRIAHLGYQPDFVIVKGDTAQIAVFRTSSMSGDNAKAASGATALASNLIQSLDSSGFTIGSNAKVNSSTIAYFWIAFKAVSGEMAVGSYTGDGNTTKAITGLGFTPALVFILPASAAEATFGSSASVNEYNFADSAGNSSWITSLDSDGFTVGSDSRVNTNGVTYHYIAWKEVSAKMKVGTYTGDGRDNRTIAGVGFQPEYVLVRDLAGDNVVQYLGSVGPSADRSLLFTASPKGPDRIQALGADGFQIGKKPDVNNPGDAYAYFAWIRSAPPTAVRLVSFTASEKDGQTILQWRTGWEANNLGFHIWRQAGDVHERMTPDLIFGSALVLGPDVQIQAGRSHVWIDDAPPRDGPLQYYLEEVDLSGKATTFGPAELDAAREGVSAHPQPTPHLSSQVPRASSLAAGLEARAAASAPLHPDPRPPRAAAVSILKLLVRKEGWQRVPIADLLAGGLDPNIDPRCLRLSTEGTEVPILIRGWRPGMLHPEGTLEFYGMPLDTPWSDTRVYWLTPGERPGKQIAVRHGQRRDRAPQSFPFTVERKDRTFYFAALRNGEAENFFGPLIREAPTEVALALSNLDPLPPTDSTLEVVLQGMSMLRHRVEVQLNGSPLGEVVFDGQAQGEERFAVPAAMLLEGGNQVMLAAKEGPADVSLLDSIRLTAWRTYRTDEASLRMTARGGEELRIGGFRSPKIRIIDITDPMSPWILFNRVIRQGDEFLVRVIVAGTGERTLLALSEEAVKKPEVALGRQKLVLGDGADMVIVSHRDFLGMLGPLKALRESEGLSVAVVDVDDIYDAFNFGEKSPWAIRNFLQAAATSWRIPPRFVLLVGDASFDPRNRLGLGDFDLVPTKLVDSQYLETASDDWFSDFDDDGVPAMAVGRLPVRTSEEANAVIGKIAENEGAAGSGEVVLVADAGNGFDFGAVSDGLRELIPLTVPVEVICRDKEAGATRGEVRDALARGPLILNYLGHGSVESWGGQVLTSADVASLEGGERKPFVVLMTCLNGFFHDLYTESLAEAFLKAPRGGAVAVWASSGLTEPSGQAEMDRALLRLIFEEPSLTIGEAVLMAKATSPPGDLQRTWILFGDPAAQLR